MKPTTNQQNVDLATLLAVIGHSPILVARTTLRRYLAPCKRLPEGFDQADIAVLDWIAGEGRRAGRTLLMI